MPRIVVPWIPDYFRRYRGLRMNFGLDSLKSVVSSPLELILTYLEALGTRFRCLSLGLGSCLPSVGFWGLAVSFKSPVKIG